jgi:hypothetical protein
MICGALGWSVLLLNMSSNVLRILSLEEDNDDDDDI